MSSIARFLLLLPLLCLGACSKQIAPEVEPIRPVLVERVGQQEEAKVFELPGEVRPQIESRLGFRVGGKLARRFVQTGDRVRVGQLLAQLDPQDLQPAVDAAAAQLEAARTEERLARADRDRTQELKDRKFVSAAQLDRAQATLDGAASRALAAQAQLQTATNALQFQALHSDSDGVILSVEAEPGQVVSAGQVVFRVARSSARDIAVAVPETELERVRRGATFTADLPALAGETIALRIREWSPLADPASRTYLVKLAPLEAKVVDRLPLGASARVRIGSKAAPGLSIPLSALHSRDVQPKVWVVDEATQTVHAIAVHPQADGLSTDRVLLEPSDASELRVGQWLVTAGANLLREGQKVRLPAGRAQ